MKEAKVCIHKLRKDVVVKKGNVDYLQRVCKTCGAVLLSVRHLGGEEK